MTIQINNNKEKKTLSEMCSHWQGNTPQRQTFHLKSVHTTPKNTTYKTFYKLVILCESH